MEKMYKKIDEFTEKNTKIWEHDISKIISEYMDSFQGERPNELMAEWMAFSFKEACKNDEYGWGTYYGPMLICNNEDGVPVESPSIKKITQEIIKYWSDRVGQVKHPLLKMRYAGLVWDFSRIISGIDPDYKMALTVIDSTVELSQGEFYEHPADVIDKFEHALRLAIALNNEGKVKIVASSIIDFETRIAVDDKPGLWGFSYDFLVRNKKVLLSEDDEKNIILRLEERLERLSDATLDKKVNPWAAEAASKRLADYYLSVGRKEEVKRVLLKFGDCFEEMCKTASAMQQIAWLQHVHSVYAQFCLKGEAEGVLRKLREIGPKVKDEMQTFSHSVEIKKEEMEEYINALMGGEMETVCARIVGHFIPKKDQVVKELRQLAQKAPLSYLFPTQIQDYKGRTVCSVGDLENDLDGNVIQHTSNNIQFSAYFLNKALKSFIEKFELSPKCVIDYLYESPVFEVEKKEIVHAGVEAYFQKDYLKFVHIIIPQVESAIRMFVELSNGVVLKPNRHTGWLQVKILDELLREECIVKTLGEDIVLYFRTVLTDQRGWNLRNDICHGITPYNGASPVAADTLFHILLCLGLIRQKDKKRNKGKEGNNASN